MHRWIVNCLIVTRRELLLITHNHRTLETCDKHWTTPVNVVALMQLACVACCVTAAAGHYGWLYDAGCSPLSLILLYHWGCWPCCWLYHRSCWSLILTASAVVIAHCIIYCITEAAGYSCLLYHWGRWLIYFTVSLRPLAILVYCITGAANHYCLLYHSSRWLFCYCITEASGYSCLLFHRGRWLLLLTVSPRPLTIIACCITNFITYCITESAR